MSAVGNALVVESELPGPALLRNLNGLSAEVFFTATTLVPEEFSVRRAVRREYRYFEPTPSSRWEGWQRAGSLFQGRVDVRSFGRALPADTPQWRSIESLEVTPGPKGLLVEVRAPSFVWGMVRKIVGALREVDRGRLTLTRLSAALSGQERLMLPMAEPEPLVLWDVQYPFRWEYLWSGPNRHQARWWESSRAQAQTRQRVLEAIAEGRSASAPIS